MNSSQPLVSVIIPSYNYARFLRDSIDSIVAQDHSSLELVVVDDKSSDNSVALLEDIFSEPAIAERFSNRLTLEVNKKNLGAHETINRGIKRSSGEYVCILNADDTFGDRRLTIMLNALKENSSRFAFSRTSFIGDDGKNFNQHIMFVQRLTMRQRSIPQYPSVGFACLASNVAISTGNFLFERKLFNEIGPFSNLRYCHDWDFLLRVLLLTEPLYVEDASYNYRIHGANTFRSLQSVAEYESAQVYRAFFEKIVGGTYRNKLAPCEDSWPGIFEKFMTAYGLWPHWPGVRPDGQL